MNSRERWTMTAVVLGSGIAFLDSTVVNVALPKIGRELHSGLFRTLEAQSFVYAGYLLALSALLILGGALGDYYGRRRMFAIGMAGFGAASVACGLAWNLDALIACRVAQGAFGALLVPGSLSLITSAFEGEARGRAFGIWAGASAVTTIAGPLVGGFLVDSISWRAAFFINIPLVAIGLYATSAHVAESRNDQASGRFDWLGAAVVALAVGGLVFGVTHGQEHQWEGALPFVSLAAGVAATVAFPFLMARSDHPLVPLGLFRFRNFTVTNISTVLIYGALYVSLYYLALFLQGVLGYTASAVGTAYISQSLFLALFSAKFGKMAAKRGPRLFMAAGPAVMGIALLWLARIPSTSTAWPLSAGDPSTYLPPSGFLTDLLPAMAVFGMGLMMMVAPLTTALMNSIPARNAGVASAVNNAISRVGPQLAGALVFVAITSSFYSSMSERVPGLEVTSPQVRQQIAPLNPPGEGVPPGQAAASREASTEAFHLAIFVAAGLLFAGAAVNGIWIRNGEGIPSDPSSEPTEEAPAAGAPPSGEGSVDPSGNGWAGAPSLPPKAGWGRPGARF